MSQPTQTCNKCGDIEIVRPDGRGFPPDIAKRRLVKRCRAKGCDGEPTYRAGIQYKIIEVTNAQLEARENELLAKLGMTWEEFVEFERTNTLGGDEWAIRDELQSIRFLRGKSPDA